MVPGPCWNLDGVVTPDRDMPVGCCSMRTCGSDLTGRSSVRTTTPLSFEFGGVPILFKPPPGKSMILPAPLFPDAAGVPAGFNVTIWPPTIRPSKASPGGPAAMHRRFPPHRTPVASICALIARRDPAVGRMSQRVARMRARCPHDGSLADARGKLQRARHLPRVICHSFNFSLV
jgi:hypothetical protein